MDHGDKSFEERLARLADVVQRLEADDATLEEGVALYREGSTLVKLCLEELETARREVRLVEDDLPGAEPSVEDKEQSK
jgi:exodeoxyribonuclease VII small subunit